MGIKADGENGLGVQRSGAPDPQADPHDIDIHLEKQRKKPFVTNSLLNDLQLAALDSDSSVSDDGGEGDSDDEHDSDGQDELGLL